ncbi:MAG TPA: hypothetical protein EYP59_18890 [Thiotrichaceae bacterium]|nr:hypothetical protein [Thiotrichaceae bacterium]
MSESQYQLKFQLHSYWRAGTGRGGGAVLDELVHKDAYGLPCLPGRTIKGLLRDAVYRAEMWGLLSDELKQGEGELTQCLFGSNAPVQEETRLETTPGALRVSDAVLDEKLQQYLIALLTSLDSENQEDGLNLRRGFFHHIHATAIEHESGTAKKTSLRGMEVTIPLTLTAQLQVLPHTQLIENWHKELNFCLPLIRAIGSSRSRGLGRVTVTLDKK